MLPFPFRVNANFPEWDLDFIVANNLKTDKKRQMFFG